MPMLPCSLKPLGGAQSNLKTPNSVFVWTENNLNTIIIWFSVRVYLKHKSKMTAECCLNWIHPVRCSVDGKHLMRFQSESSVFTSLSQPSRSTLRESHSASFQTWWLTIIIPNHKFHVLDKGVEGQQHYKGLLTERQSLNVRYTYQFVLVY